MKRLIFAFVLTVLSFSPYLARAGTDLSDGVQLASGSSSPKLPIPDISTWTIVSISRTELRVSDITVAYLCLEVEYNNPNNPREFVRVISRHTPLIISKQKLGEGRLFSEIIVVFYAKKEEQDRLTEIVSKSDPLIYTWWRTKRNSDTGTDMQDGDVNIWFLQSDGNWSSFRNKKINIEFLTENIGNGKPHNVFTGMKYQIKDDAFGDFYHIVRVDRDDLAKLFKEDR